jgi:ribonuclease-3
MAEDNLRTEPAEGALEALAPILGYPDGAFGRLDVAITHKSHTNEAGTGTHNERLEFLGDAVLDLIVGEALMRAHPDAPEGQLSRLRASIVNTRSLADVARSMSLGDALRLGRGEAMTGGRTKDSLLADVFEAVLGAVYSDLGLDAARRLVLSHLGPQIEHQEVIAARRDYKTVVQELVQASHQTTPVYRLVASRGPDHDKRFEIQVEVLGEVLGVGVGRSKKAAEQEAARVAWEALSPQVGGG